MKKCIFCAEDIQDDAKVCKHCGKEQKRKTPLWQWLLLILLGFLIYGFFSSNKTVFTTKPEINPFIVKVTKFYTEYDYYNVIGYVQNKGERSYQYVRVKTDFYDKNNNLAGTDWTYACGNDYIQPGARKTFKLSGSDSGDYHTVRVEIESYR